MHIFNLTCINVRKAHFHSYGEIDDDIIGFGRFQNIKNGVANFKCIFRLGACETFG
jgi:hypothetical protein